MLLLLCINLFEIVSTGWNRDISKIPLSEDPKILACIELHKRKKIKILFDDIDMMKDVEKLLFASFKINKSIKPKCIFRNLYVEIELNKNSIQKFKRSFLFLYFKHYITSKVVLAG